MAEQLEAIIEYGMTPLEARAYKVMLFWHYIVRKELPGYKIGKPFQKGDPRKSALFRYCFKLVTETNGLIRPSEYKLYVTAQIQMLKAQTDGMVHAMIGPECLVGKKAWIRWAIWKRKYDEVIARNKVEVVT
jgi:hypothetical protein